MRTTIMRAVCVALVAFPTIVKAEAPKAPDWTGWYAGGFAGYADGEATGDVDINTTNHFDDNGLMAGVLGGYRYQTKSGWVLGGEIVVPIHIDKGHAVDKLFFPGQVFYESEGKFAIMAGIQAGYAMGRVLPYIYGAAGVARVTGRTLNVDQDDNLSPGSAQKDSASPFIWQAGVGLDFQATDRFTLGGRVGYFHVNKADYTMSWNEPGPNLFGWNALLGQVVVTYRFSR